MRLPLKDSPTPLFFLAATVFVVLAVIGGVRSYSPVPYADMWNGYLNFYIRILEGDWSAWWAQHNEHRILLARLFFWVDLHFFDGKGWFLILVNYMLVGTSCLVFARIIREQVGKRDRWPTLFVTAILFLWTQHENLTWGFQSQFILAQLIPLAALHCLHLAARTEQKTTREFVLATALGVVSIATMANGILTLPLMSILAMILRMSWKRCAVLIGSSIGSILIYFSNFKAPENHGSLLQTVKTTPVEIIKYVALYIGSPFFYLFEQMEAGIHAAMICGFILIVLSMYVAGKELLASHKSSLRLSLLTFILYIGGTAFGTAGGRLVFGLHQALASRYGTPALMAWIAIFVLFVPAITSFQKPWMRRPWIVFILLLVLMLPQQLTALSSRISILQERCVAALALELNVADRRQIMAAYPFPDWVISFAHKPSGLNLSIFGLPPIKDARERLGAPAPTRSQTHSNIGSIDAMYLIPGEPDFIGVRGWFFDREAKRAPEMVDFVNQDGLIVGMALTGQPRADVAGTIDPQAAESGFKGYLLSSALGQIVEVRDAQGHPGFSIQLPTVKQ